MRAKNKNKSFLIKKENHAIISIFIISISNAWATFTRLITRQRGGNMCLCLRLSCEGNASLTQNINILASLQIMYNLLLLIFLGIVLLIFSYKSQISYKKSCINGKFTKKMIRKSYFYVKQRSTILDILNNSST